MPIVAKLVVKLIVESTGAADLLVAECDDPDIWAHVLGEIKRWGGPRPGPGVADVAAVYASEKR